MKSRYFNNDYRSLTVKIVSGVLGRNQEDWIIRISRSMLLVVSSFLILGARLLAATTQSQADSPAAQTPSQSAQTNSKHPASGHETIKYVNTEYRFTFLLPRSWKGYSILAGRWEDTPQDEVRETGPEITIRHPQWRDEHQRQDFTIMVFTHAQWNSLQHGDFAISAASIGPGEIGHNRKYVFAVPPRMIDSDNLYGWKEVVRIMRSNPLRAF